MWDKISLWQYQQIYKTITNKEFDDLDIKTKILGVILDKTETQIDALTKSEYLALLPKLDFLNDEIKGKAVKYITIGKKRYRVIYDVTKMPFARYVESKVFSQDLYGNMHKIAASMVMPQKKVLWFWVDDKYNAGKHEEYSQDMLEANFTDVYFTLVFFYQVYRNWIEVSQDYLVAKMVERGMKIEQANQAVQDLCIILDGSIAPNLLPITKIAKLRKSMKAAQYPA